MAQPAPPAEDDPGFHDQDPGPRPTLRGWLAADPARRGVAAGPPALWLTAAGLYECGVTWQWTGSATVAASAAAACAAMWAADRPRPAWEQDGEAPALLAPGEAALLAGGAGGWLTLAGQLAPWARPAWWPTIALGGLAAGSWQWLRDHNAVTACRLRADDARMWVQRKTEWHVIAARVPELGGTHLLDRTGTLVGELLLADTTGTGGYATDIRAKRVEEGVAQFYGLPRGRVDCWVDDIPGRIWIAIRYRDPWKRPIIHPLVKADSIAAKYLEGYPTAKRPLVIGLDPEDGEPFGIGGGPARPDGLPVWVPGQGGQVILFVGTKGAGKTNGLNVLTERLTACEDSRVLQVNLTAPGDMEAWEPACPASALGRGALYRARALLAWTDRYIDAYSRRSSEPYATPSPAFPHLTVIIDEVADVADDKVCKELMRAVVRKCRRAGATLVIAGQRATAQWIGGSDIRSLIDIVVLGRHTRPEDVDKALGIHLDLPDIGAYGKGKHGVFMIVELVSGEYGRAGC